jgi:hypothetical protein
MHKKQRVKKTTTTNNASKKSNAGNQRGKINAVRAFFFHPGIESGVESGGGKVAVRKLPQVDLTLGYSPQCRLQLGRD